MTTTKNRKKVNFMISNATLKKMETLIPRGERSDFVNETLQEALIQFARKKAFEKMDTFADTHQIRLSNEEIMTLKNYGRP